MARDFSEAAKSWDQEPRRVQLAKDLVAAMRAEIEFGPEQVVIDFGTGTGLIARGLSSFVRKVIAVDTAPGMLEVLARKIRAAGIKNIEPRLWDLSQEPEAGIKADVIVSAMTMHHLPELEPAASAFEKMLNPGGRIALADLDLEGGRFHPDPSGVYHHGFDRGALAKIFSAAGFRSVAFRDAATVTRPITDGSIQTFSIFLLTAAQYKMIWSQGPIRAECGTKNLEP